MGDQRGIQRGLADAELGRLGLRREAVLGTGQQLKVAETYARLVVAARWWIVAFWAAGVLVSMTVLPSFGASGGGNGLQGLLNTETPAVQTEFRDFRLFGFPLSSRTIVVQHDAAGSRPTPRPAQWCAPWPCRGRGPGRSETCAGRCRSPTHGACSRGRRERAPPH